jgi:GTP:adenosylcobinamide-phosphate guanylyltransferase
MKVDAVILAGGDGAIIDPTVRIKGLAPIAGKPMVEWVVDAMRAADTVADVAVVVPTAERLGTWADKADKIVVSDGTFMENVVAGLDAFRNDRSVLVATGDLPALLPEAIDDYVDRSLEAGADFSYPLVSKESMEEQFPGSQRTYVKLVSGEVTGGNMALLSPALVYRNKEIGQRLFDTRKSPVRMAKVIGGRFIVKLLLGRLDPHDVEKKMAQLLGGSCSAISTDHASIGADVDKPIDVVVTERVLFSRESE